MHVGPPLFSYFLLQNTDSNILSYQYGDHRDAPTLFNLTTVASKGKINT